MGSGRLPGTPRLLRALNDRAALELLIARGPLTRAQLGSLTGLSKVTASQLVERLEARGLVRRVGEQAGGRGPNAQLYAVRPDSAYVVGVDVDPDRVVAACADITGAVLGRATRPIRDVDEPFAVVHGTVVEAVADAEIPAGGVRRIVFGTPGLADPTGDGITFAFHPPAWHQGLLAALRADFDAPVVFENDVNLAAITEGRAGAAVGVNDFVLMWVGVGLGLAVVLGGRLHRGSTGAAGEIGYLPVPGLPIGRHVEPAFQQLAGSDAGVSQGGAGRDTPAFQQLAGSDSLRAVAERAGFPARGAGEAVRAVVAAGEAGRPVLDELARRLALGVASVCVVLDPPLVVLAGEVGRAGGRALADRVRRGVADMAPVNPRVEATGVDEEPVLQGALCAALDAVRDEVFGSTVG